jgi:hypothetical protein
VSTDTLTSASGAIETTANSTATITTPIGGTEETPVVVSIPNDIVQASGSTLNVATTEHSQTTVSGNTTQAENAALNVAISANSTYTVSGDTTQGAGASQAYVAAPSSSLVIDGNIAQGDNATTAFTASASSTVAVSGAITGNTTTQFNIDGDGDVHLTGNSASYGGTMNVAGVAMQIDQTLGSSESKVALTGTGVTLKGAGTIGGTAALAANTVVAVTPIANQTFTLAGPITGESTTQLNFTGADSTSVVKLKGDSSSFAGAIAAMNTTMQLDNGTLGANSSLALGAGVTLAGSGTINSTTAVNHDVAVAPALNSSLKLSGPLTGSNAMIITGSGTSSIVEISSASGYSGPIGVSNAGLRMNTVTDAPITATNGAQVLGNFTVPSLTQTDATIKPGNSIGTATITQDYIAAGNSHYAVEVKPLKGSSDVQYSNFISVGRTAELPDTYVVDMLMNAGTYSRGTYDYTILTVAKTDDAGVLTMDSNKELKITWTEKAGMTWKLVQSDDMKSLIARLTATQDITIEEDQSEIGLISSHDPVQTVTESGVVGTSIPVADASEIDLVAIISNSNQAQKIETGVEGAVGDNFRFKPVHASTTKGLSTLEVFLKAAASKGPVSVERNETRLWISPIVNRSRISKTNNDAGSQGWSGGSLVGLEQRDRKNTWTWGLLAGAMASRSHTLGSPDTKSKTLSGIFGIYNNLKYSEHWGHELYLTRTMTGIKGQRYGTDTTTKAPFFAKSAYKTTSDAGSAQINYLFDMLPKIATCRINGGTMYQQSKTGSFTETGAGSNNMTTSAVSAKSLEAYMGVGVRRIWKFDDITIRTTLVYEYGYDAMSNGKPATQTTSSAATYTSAVTPRQNKHYVQLSSSYLNRKTGFKYIVLYSGKYYKNVANHTGMFKFEYRF